MAEAAKKETKNYENLNTVKLDAPPKYGTPVAEGSNFYTKTNKAGEIVTNKTTGEPQQFGSVSFKVGKEISQDGYAHMEVPAGAIKESQSREGMYNVYVPNETLNLRVNTGMDGEKKVYETKEFPRDDVVKSHNKQQGYINQAANKVAEKAEQIEAPAAEAEGPEMG